MHSKGTDNIIGLIIIQLQSADSHAFQNLHRQRKLLAQLARSRLTLRLVLRIQLAAEGFARFIKGNRHITRLHLIQKLQQHIAQAVHCSRMDTLTRSQRRQSKKRSMYQAAAIYY